MEELHRHEPDTVALGFGLAFALVAILGLTGTLDEGTAAGWLAAGLLAVVAISVATTVLVRRRSDDKAP